MKTYQDLRDHHPAAWLAPRPPDSHKGDFGQVGILGGASGMAGAALLAGRAALRLGAGRVYVGLIDDRLAVDPGQPELMLCRPERLLSLSLPGCLAAGPGLGQTGTARAGLEALLGLSMPLVLDADALNQIAADPALAGQVRSRTGPTLLTPHAGEAGRLLGIDSATLQRDRAGALQALVDRFRCGVLLKGRATLIGFPDRPPWRNPSGNPALASAGMGDVLTGMIAALAAQGLDLERAAVLAAWLHGEAADSARARGEGPVGLSASELVPGARARLNRLVYSVP
ncbi:MAG: NAD(P)H-hydrate dehydratase [Pseudomonadota bacterium]